MLDLDTIMTQLDDWVIFHKTGYLPSDCRYGPTTPQSYGIEQVREEIREFIAVLILNNRFNSVLEVGLGYWGGTHFLWQLMFKYVATIERSKKRISMYINHCKKYYNKPLVKEQNLFFNGWSFNPGIATTTFSRIPAQSLDLLFIDGGHQYEIVKIDWILYNHLAAPGGIVAFHDVAAPDAGVGKFINELSEGKIDGMRREIGRIIHSNDRGIAYYVQGE